MPRVSASPEDRAPASGPQAEDAAPVGDASASPEDAAPTATPQADVAQPPAAGAGAAGQPQGSEASEGGPTQAVADGQAVPDPQSAASEGGPTQAAADGQPVPGPQGSEATEGGPTQAAADGQPVPEPQSAEERERQGARIPRLSVAVTRVGGPEVVRAALAPKQDENGQPMKWAAVCALQAQGLRPGDPAFAAWIRLAATPVREVKAEVRDPEERPRRGGRGGAGPRGGGQGGRGGESGRGGRSEARAPRRERAPDGSRPASREELANFARDGMFRTSVRIVADGGEEERRERERRRKEQREAKRQAERERLARLGY
jgi:hypothetical protein